MNRIIKALCFLFLLFFSIHILNNKFLSLPPIGKFLDPFHGYAQSYKNHNDKIVISILKDSVEVIWDENNIPHIYAQNEKDLYTAQGYVVAQDRLWQMDFISRVYAGRLSEIIGYDIDVITNDRFMRTIGIPESAKASLSTIASCNIENQIDYNWDGMEESCLGNVIVNDGMQKVYDMLLSYSKGVNQYIQSIDSRDYPLEYKILDYTPELWNPLKTCILLKSMTLTLTGRNTDIVYEYIENQYSKDDAEALFPEFPYFVDPIISEFDSMILDEFDSNNCNDFSENSINIEDDFYGLISNLNTMYNPGIGSNNWAVHKDYTKNGNAILANDPHLGLSLPNVWYVMQLSTPDIDIMGATFPGAPSILSGFNNYIAWGETNGEDDVSDFFRIETTADNKKYLYDQDTLEFDLRKETIYIRGNALEFPSDTTFYVKSTKHGPILIESNNDRLSKHSTSRGIETKKNYAFRWTAHDPSKEIKAFYELNQSKDYEDFLEALSNYDCPGQNFIYADIDGNIGMYHRGKTPIRCGKGVLPGNNSNYLWTYDDSSKFIPDKHLPKILNPAVGYVSSANQYPVKKDYPYYLPGKYWPAYRGSRINDNLNFFINEGNGITIEDMATIQNDSYNKFAEIILPQLLDAIKDSIYYYSNQELIDIYESLSNWNMYHESDFFEPLIFDQWIDDLNQSIWKDEFLNSGLTDISNSRIYPYDDVLFYFIENDKDSKWFDDKSTNNAKENFYFIAWNAFLKTIESLKSHSNLINKNFTNWKYSDVKGADIRHLIGSENFNAFSRLDVPVSGSKWSPNAMKVKYGPSWRYIVDLKEDSIKAIGIYPGGQSGNPGSRYYDNYIYQWKEGKYFDLNFTPYHKKNQLNEESIRRVVIVND